MTEGPVPWVGLTKVTQKADDTNISTLYYDGVPFATTQTKEDFGLTVEAWTYPDEFDPYLGNSGDLETNQSRKPFDLSWRDDIGESHLIHLVWNALAVDQDLPYSSKNDELEVTMLTWDIFATPEVTEGIHPTAHLVVDTDLAPEAAVEALEDIIYGSSTTDPRFPETSEVIDLFLDHAVLVVTDNGDGTWTATGPDEAFTLVGDIFTIRWPSALFLSPIKYKISSM